MQAIDRYAGAVYDILGPGVKEKLRSRSIDNVLIVSSLFGIIHPTDMIPDYELMMKDKGPSKTTVHRWWSDALRRCGFRAILEGRYPGLKEVYCFMSDTTGYVQTVEFLKASLRMHVVHVEEGSTGASTRAWGNGLRSCLEESASTPEDVKRIVELEGCRLIQL